jgi:hypothetical protein
MPLLLIPCVLFIVLVSLPRPGGPAHPPAPPAPQGLRGVQIETFRTELVGQRKILEEVEKELEVLNRLPVTRGRDAVIETLREKKDQITRSITTLERGLTQLEKDD